ncbi:3-keto-5-aminohexanoate cleavage protein [Roseovarius sp. SCSIO 43702]|uniref:3-keto-5-aminohexanoate cleavage protein n=1 Tax=Roseovarius sp. SCSIO 43702 TaxID=2823043 RepID=UPI001C7368F0|nr:3-keto-5-aminohexanoate cleavage protein [Roseovarius sp. SCSIO 43702]QYX58134.1 3-keto-5-aminohexanoate cleavage protein [Roseovarius sp. SCSIO 43702]
MERRIITCAITGSIHTPSMSPYLPYRPEDIAAQAIEAAEAGATILHLHARDPRTGRPSGDPEHYAAFLPRIAAGCDAVINLTTGGSAVMTLEERLRAALQFCPEMCSLNMGTMNFALYPMAEKPREWLFEWEEPFLRGSDDLVFKNTPRDIAGILEHLGCERGARFEFECYDIGHLYMLRHFVDRGLVAPPYFIQFVFGVLGGMGADPDTLDHMIALADKLFGNDYLFSVLAAGRHQIPMARRALERGGHVRVGLEDNLMIAKGELAQSNAAQVEQVRRIIAEMGLAVATPDEARVMLELKGADKVAV